MRLRATHAASARTPGQRNARVALAGMVVVLLAAGCGESPSRSAEAASLAPPANQTSSSSGPVTSSKATYMTLTNALTLADGTPMTVTWRVSDTRNEFWDGSSRADHAPPQGLQGLVQASNSGPYTTRLEVNDNTFTSTKPNFTLTPIISIDGQEVSLQPMLMVFTYSFWQMVLNNGTPDVRDGCRSLPPLTAQTPRGPLTYTIEGKCADPTSSFSLRSVS